MKTLLQKLSSYIQDKVAQLYKYRVIMAALALFFLPLWFMDQGQDLLVNSNSSSTGVVVLLTSILMAAFLNWYLSKLYFNYFSPDLPFPILPIHAPVPHKGVESEKKMARFLGTATILIPAAAILNALQAIRVHNWMSGIPPLGWLAILMIGFYLLIRSNLILSAYLRISQRLDPSRAMWLAWLLIVLLGLGIPLVIRLAMNPQIVDKPNSLIYLFWHMILLASAFVLFVNVREQFPFPDRALLQSRIGLPVLLSGGLLSLIFAYTNIIPLGLPDAVSAYAAIPVFLSGIAAYSILVTGLIRAGRRWKINVLFFLVIIGLACALFIPNNYHRIRQTRVLEADQAPPRLEEYFRGWLLSRQDEIKKVREYPVFLVNSYGGGIRAAAFTQMTLSYLDSVTAEGGKKPFSHFLFSLSGASGGTIGSMLHCAFRYQFPSQPAFLSYPRLDSFYRSDFLSPVLSTLLGRDTWASVTGQEVWKDRAAVQESIFAQKAIRLGYDLNKSFDTYWRNEASGSEAYEVPLLFSNSLNVDDGFKSIYAPVNLSDSDFPATHFIRDSIKKGYTLSLVTGSFLSARFPIISPTGKLNAGLHFLDGGAQDNSGAGTSAQIFLSLLKYIQRELGSSKDSSWREILQKIHFHFVSISNSPHVRPEIRRRLPNRLEIMSPLVGIINSGIYGNARSADSTIRIIYGGRSITFEGLGNPPDYYGIWPTLPQDTLTTHQKDSSGYLALLPLGWQISEPSLDRLHRTFEDIRHPSDQNDLEKLLRLFQP